MRQNSDSVLAVYFGTTKIAAFRATLLNAEDVRIDSWRWREPLGFESGLIRDVEEAERDLAEVILPVAEPASPSEFPLLFVLSNPEIKTYAASSSIYFAAPRVISNREVSQVVRQTREMATIPLSEKIFRSEPQGFLADDIAAIKSPLDLTASRLGVSLQIFTLPFSIYQAFENLAARFDLEPISWASRGVASSYGVLRDEEKKEGVCLIELGGKVTELLVFKNSLLQAVRVAPFGTEWVTEELASDLKVSLAESRSLKERYGSLEKGGGLTEQWLPVKEPNGRKGVQITLADFHEKLRRAADGLLERLGKELSQLKENHKPIYSVVLSGGGTRLDGFLELAEEEFSLPVRLGLVTKVQGPSDLISFPNFCSPLGLLRQQAAQHQRDVRFQRELSPVTKTVGKIREWIQEYF